ncbi:mechanosensitive ion channel protein MscS [Pontibacter diazotrophicus]|uniref:Mechanosensitive ion channel protein MscS n=1 Tax=Pontibacter diazotrophicus TaxID=1400979 RepID=A0A3D8LGY7_9BACT|nr:mechanosensitive ion channel domain-containing protein [Pontibacter diazotrophicus]RDV16719.1 mechanosensitive ion channel protein MscS [Pontibacter diazotrophicus]
MPPYNQNRRLNRSLSSRNRNVRTPIQQRSTTQQPGGSDGVRTQQKYRARNRKRRVAQPSKVKGAAENRLKNFRQASILAVAITGFIIMLTSPSEAGLAQDAPQEETVDSVAIVDEVALEDLVAAPSDTAAADSTLAGSSKESADQAIGALQNLWDSFYFNLPKMLIAIGILVLAWLLTKALRALLHRTIGRWQSSSAVTTLTLIVVWLLAIGIAVSVVAGDIRALVGSFGLIGLALSWSLQTPIESFTGWLLNSFQGYYKVGDRIRVGEVFGDVYRIDFLTTTVWEIGAPYQPGFVQAEQPTGRMVTFPNNEIVTGTVINLTGDFPFVWDELSVAVANESDIELSIKVMEQISTDLLGDYMIEPARSYARLLRKAGLGEFVAEKPQVFISLDDSWTNITIRYLVGARERRKWKSELTLRIAQELAKPEYLKKIIPVYPRQQVQFINPEGVPVDSEIFKGSGEK